MGIVERLRNLAKLIDFKIGSNLANEAADLIERLREALERIAGLSEDFESEAAMTSHERQMFHLVRAALKEIEGD